MCHVHLYLQERHPYIGLENVVETRDRLQKGPTGHVSKGPVH